ncbi:hypothetical protein ACSYAD_20740 [Acaryochloris marina NIES-2412]|uniref:hypothetical protein n=1 Tax=Acaryochloris marina TaxID=155978 RepID=UPI0040583838
MEEYFTTADLQHDLLCTEFPLEIPLDLQINNGIFVPIPNHIICESGVLEKIAFKLMVEEKPHLRWKAFFKKRECLVGHICLTVSKGFYRITPTERQSQKLLDIGKGIDFLLNCIMFAYTNPPCDSKLGTEYLSSKSANIKAMREDGIERYSFIEGKRGHWLRLPAAKSDENFQWKYIQPIFKIKN